MSAHCCDHEHVTGAPHGPFRRVLWLVLAINAAMFATETAASFYSGSAALLADAMDFLGDAGNYAISLVVLGMAPRWRTAAALVKSACMLAFGLWVIATAVHHFFAGAVPEAPVMAKIGALALAANLAAAFLLYRYRQGDANMRSAWLCTRNDVLGNLAVLAAASGVFAADAGWPDVLVAAVMAALALVASRQVARQALAELRLVGV
jgi:Co/Zn/Cd efflux system component